MKKIVEFYRSTIGKSIIALVIIVCLIVGGYYYYTGTPQYALAQIKKAYQTHNVTLAMKYIDTDTVFDNLWLQIQAGLATQTTQSDNPWEQAGTLIGQGLIENMKPGLKEKFKTQLVDAFKTGTTTSDLFKLTESPKISRDGDTVIVQGDGQTKIKLEKEGQHYWRVVAIEGLNEESTSTPN